MPFRIDVQSYFGRVAVLHCSSSTCMKMQALPDNFLCLKCVTLITVLILYVHKSYVLCCKSDFVQYADSEDFADLVFRVVLRSAYLSS